MLTMQTILEQLTGRHIVEAFVQQMAEKSEGFAADRQRYIDAMDVLQKELGDAVLEERDAIERQLASDLLLSGFLGLKANLNNFIDPIARNFLDVDFDVYLREETAHRLPEYERAEKSRDRLPSFSFSQQRSM